MKSNPKPWVRWIENDEATGLLARIYQAALARAGRIWNIVRMMSLRPQALQGSLSLYQSIMRTSSARLGRAEREMIAVVVSEVNGCRY